MNMNGTSTAIGLALENAGFKPYEHPAQAGFVVGALSGVVLNDWDGLMPRPVAMIPSAFTIEYCLPHIGKRQAGLLDEAREILKRYFSALQVAGYKCSIGNQCVILYCT